MKLSSVAALTLTVWFAQAQAGGDDRLKILGKSVVVEPGRYLRVDWTVNSKSKNRLTVFDHGSGVAVGKVNWDGMAEAKGCWISLPNRTESDHVLVLYAEHESPAEPGVWLPTYFQTLKDEPGSSYIGFEDMTEEDLDFNEVAAALRVEAARDASPVEGVWYSGGRPCLVTEIKDGRLFAADPDGRRTELTFTASGRLASDQVGEWGQAVGEWDGAALRWTTGRTWVRTPPAAPSSGGLSGVWNQNGDERRPALLIQADDGHVLLINSEAGRAKATFLPGTGEVAVNRTPEWGAIGRGAVLRDGSVESIRFDNGESFERIRGKATDVGRP